MISGFSSCSSALHGGDFAEQMRETGLPFLDHDRVSLGDMPDPVLLKIVSYIPTFTQKYPLQLEVKEAIRTFYALGKVNRRLHGFFSENYTRGLFVKALLERTTLVRAKRNEAFNHVLNLGLNALEMGFRLYLKCPKNKFFKVRALDQKIDQTVNEFLDKAKTEIKNGPTFSYSDWVKSGYFGDAECAVRVYYDHVLISTLSRSIKIEAVLPKYEAYENQANQTAPSITIADFLIKRLGATFEVASGTNFCEILRLDPSEERVRKITHQELKLMRREELGSLVGTQRVIVPFGFRGVIRYKVKSIGIQPKPKSDREAMEMDERACHSQQVLPKFW